MALTLNQLVGFETGGLEEALATSGSPDPTEATIVRSGDRSLKFDGASTQVYTIDLFSEIASAGNDHIFGFGIRFDTGVTPSSNVAFLNVGTNMTLRLETSGDFILIDNSGTTLSTISSPFTIGQFHFIEMYFQNLGSSAAWEIFIDGVSKDSGSTGDFVGGTGLEDVDLNGESTLDGAMYVDDFYWLSGATAASDRFGTGWRVTGNQIGNTSAVPDFDSSGVSGNGETLDGGTTWSNTGRRPWTDAGLAQYTLSTAETGCVALDNTNSNGDSPGPLSGPDTIGTIKGAKFIWRGDRSGGGATTHAGLYGAWDGSGNMDSIGNTGDFVLLAGTLVNHFVTKEASDANVPTALEDFVMGLDKGAGGRDWDCYEMHAMLGHVVAADAGVEVLPDASTVSIAAFAPTIQTGVSVDAALSTVAISAQVPIVGSGASVQPDASTVAIAVFAPTIQTGVSVEPTAATVVVSAFAPEIQAALPVNILPGVSTVDIAVFAPVVSSGASVQPDASTVVIATQTPAVGTSVKVQPGVSAIAVTAFAPTVETGVNVETGPDPERVFVVAQTPAVGTSVKVEPGTAAVVVAALAPTIETGVNIEVPLSVVAVATQAPVVSSGASVQPDVSAVVINTFAPTIEAEAAGGVEILPGVSTVEIIAQTPAVASGASVQPAAAVVVIAAQTPTIQASLGVDIQPDAAVVNISALAPTIQTGVSVEPDASAVVISAQTPAVGTSVNVRLDTATIAITAFAPTIETGVNIEPGVATVDIAVLTPAVGTSVDVQPGVSAAVVAVQTPIVGSGASVDASLSTVVIATQAPVAGSGANVAGETASVAISVFAPELEVGGEPVVVLPDAAEVVIAAFAPTIQTGVDVTPAVSTVEVSVLTPAVAAGASVQPGVAAVVIAAQAPTLETGVEILPPVAAVDINAQTPVVASGASIAPAAAAVVIATFVPVLDVKAGGQIEDVPAAAVVITAPVPVVASGVNIAMPAPAAITLTGIIPAAVEIILPFTTLPGMFDIGSLDTNQVPVLPYGTILTDRADGNTYLLDIFGINNEMRLEPITFRNGLRAYAPRGPFDGPVVDGFRVYSENQLIMIESIGRNSVAGSPVNNLTSDKNSVFEARVVDGVLAWTSV